VLAFEVTTFEGMAPQEAEALLSRARSVLAGGEYIRQVETMDRDKATLIVRMGQHSGR